jgi:hypothetical protein
MVAVKFLNLVENRVMENASNNKNGKTKGQIFLDEWKKRRKEDEEKFLKELNDPEHRKLMDGLKGKIVRNGKIVSAS